MNDILRLCLNKYKNNKNKNKKKIIKFYQASSLNIYPTHEKTKNVNNVNYNLYDSNNKYEIIISNKEKNKKENLKKINN